MTLEELTRNPASAAGLPKTELAALLVQCAAAMSAIGATILDQPEPARLNEDADDQYLSVNEAAVLLHRNRRWVYRNAGKLPFVSPAVASFAPLFAQRHRTLVDFSLN